MAISNYAELKSAVADWLERSDLTVRIPEFIALAEASINRALRVRRMIARSTASLDHAFSQLPADYLEAKSLTLSDGTCAWRLGPSPPEVVVGYSVTGRTGRPAIYSATGDELQLYPAPDRAYAATLTYYARIPALSDANSTNWLLGEHPDVYLYGALLAAAPYLRDAEALQIFSAGYATALEAIRSAERTPAGTLRTEEPVTARSCAITTDI